jgi:hypothetical protein
LEVFYVLFNLHAFASGGGDRIEGDQEIKQHEMNAFWLTEFKLEKQSLTSYSHYCVFLNFER